MGAVAITFPDRVEDRDALEAMIFDYYAGIFPKVLAVGGPELSAAEFTAAMIHDYYSVLTPKLEAMGGPKLHISDLVADTMNELEEFLPPTGRLVLAHDQDGRLVGFGSMRTCAPG
ncbi:MAG: hypothetical protein KJO15_14780, partial [Alphaproteobacteria bacterium]|nr:hypothetical protein [Alphaproteobacteria bacterium]